MFTKFSDKEYSPILINRRFSYENDTIFQSNLMNIYGNDLTSEQQFVYYNHTISHRKRWSRWYKEKIDKDTMEYAKEHQISYEKARIING